MGYYINPSDMSKEQFLEENGHLITARRVEDVLSGKLFDGLCFPVCLVSNGAFTAAGIVYCSEEAKDFQGKDDPRPKIWYAVPKSKLRPYMDEKFFATEE